MDDEENESEIIKRVLAGQRDEFRHLILRHQNKIFSLLMRSLKNSANAEDLTQDVFVKAYSNLHQFRFEASFGTWLCQIAINQLNTFYSSSKYRQLKQTEVFDQDKHDIAMTDKDSHTKDLLLHFQQALKDLDPKFRDVLNLCAIEGATYEEAATLFGLPVGTVRSRINTARLKIKAAMHNHFKGGKYEA